MNKVLIVTFPFSLWTDTSPPVLWPAPRWILQLLRRHRQRFCSHSTTTCVALAAVSASGWQGTVWHGKCRAIPGSVQDCTARASYSHACLLQFQISLSLEVIHVTEAWPCWWYRPKFPGSLLHPVRRNSEAQVQALLVSENLRSKSLLNWSTRGCPQKQHLFQVGSMLGGLSTQWKITVTRITANPRNEHAILKPIR